MDYKAEQRIEATRQLVAIRREEARAAQYIADLYLTLRETARGSEVENNEKVYVLNAEENDALYRDLKEEIPSLYQRILEAPETETMRETAPISTPNRTTYWRGLEINGLGEIAVSYIVDIHHQDDVLRYALEVGNLPIVSGRSRARESTLLEFEPKSPVPGGNELPEETIDLLNHRDVLQSICDAAGIGGTE
jgi:hypothetical protein